MLSCILYWLLLRFCFHIRLCVFSFITLDDKMNREADRQKIKQILTATIVSLCNNGMNFSTEMTIEGLLGITIDHSDVLLVNIHETVGRQKPDVQTPSDALSRSSINSAVADHLHEEPLQVQTGQERRVTSQQQHPSESLCSAVQPYYGKQILGGFDNTLSTTSGGSNQLSEQQFERQSSLAADSQRINHGKVQALICNVEFKLKLVCMLYLG